MRLKPRRLAEGVYALMADRLPRNNFGRVELWHFGPGNSPGDTVVHVPEARAAWTGNLLRCAGHGNSA